MVALGFLVLGLIVLAMIRIFPERVGVILPIGIALGISFHLLNLNYPIFLSSKEHKSIINDWRIEAMAGLLYLALISGLFYLKHRKS